MYSLLCLIVSDYSYRVVSSMFMFVMVVATLYDVIYVQWLAKKQTPTSEIPAPLNVYQVTREFI